MVEVVFGSINPAVETEYTIVVNQDDLIKGITQACRILHDSLHVVVEDHRPIQVSFVEFMIRKD
jgi:hypothetical protein